ncbi:tetratricopeptide repeat-containing sensor histidine kinase [Winogradskyella sp. PC-19]|uniref:tetratricopeptide repeat-containing sensor histidine kinase n=1 Tax=Winogradskyella sp. PC-19 TaxID=754417 RepID=UPI0018DF4855|nr:tetratricopeptide repeat-containing sensor histidine kinase [Winogradskyella sp. PC-19]
MKLINDSKNDNDIIDAISFFRKDNVIQKQENNSIRLVYNLTYIARGQRKMGVIYEAENSAVEAIKILDDLEEDNFEYKIPLYNSLGILYLELEDYETSLKFYNKVLELNEDPKNIATIINNIGKVYFGLKDYESAIKFYEKSYQGSLYFDDKKNTARALDNLGFAQSKIANLDAIENLTEALKMRQNLNYTPGIIESYLHIGEYYKDRNKRKIALEYSNKAIEVAEATGNSDYLLNTLSFYSKLNRDSKILKLKRLEDSINKSNRLAQNKYASKKYAYEKQEKLAKENQLKAKDADIRAKEAELSSLEQKRYKTIYLLLGSIIFISSIFLFFLLKSKHKKEKLQQVYKTESRISKKVHDEIANDVFQVMTNLEAEADINSNLKSNIEHIYDKARDISKQLGELNITGDFKTILNDLAINYTNSDTNVILKDVSKIQWEKVSDIKKTALYKVLQELLINMKKHSKASIAVITFNSSSKKIIINYKDDGIGCHLKKSNGLLNVENRINAISGRINFESEINKGFKAIIEV